MGYVAVGALKVVDEIETRVYPAGLVHESEGRLIREESPGWKYTLQASKQAKALGGTPGDGSDGKPEAAACQARSSKPQVCLPPLPPISWLFKLPWPQFFSQNGR